MGADSPSKIISSYKPTLSDNQLLSRYKNLKRLVNEDGVSYIETPSKLVIRESSRDTMFTVEAGYENRIDLVSYKFYGTPYLWWAIALLNNLENPRILEVGVILRIPPLDNIQL